MRGEDFGVVARPPLRGDPDQVEEAHGFDCRIEAQKERGAFQERHGDEPKPLSPAGPIERGRLVKRGIDRLDGRQIDQHAESVKCPGTGRIERQERRAGFREPCAAQRAEADQIENIIQKAEDRIVNPAPDDAGNDKRNGARQKVKRAHKPDGSRRPFSEYGGEDETDQQRETERQNRPDRVVPERRPEHAVRRQTLIIRKAAEGLDRPVVPRKHAVGCDLQDWHRDKSYIEQQGRQHEQQGLAAVVHELVPRLGMAGENRHHPIWDPGDGLRHPALAIGNCCLPRCLNGREERVRRLVTARELSAIPD